MANSIWDPTQYQVDYSATGDDVDKLAQQYIALVNGVFDLLNMLKAWSPRAFEPAEKSSYLIWSDTTDCELKMRNSDNSAWITLGKLTDKLGMTPAYIGAVKDSGVSEVIAGLEADRPSAGIAERWFVARNTGRIWQDNGSEWELLLSLNWEDIKGRPKITLSKDVTGNIDLYNSSNFSVDITVNQAEHATNADNATHAANADMLDGKGSTSFAAAVHSHTEISGIPIDLTNKAVGRTLVVRDLGAGQVLVFENAGSGSGGAGAIDDASNTRTDASWSCYWANLQVTQAKVAANNAATTANNAAAKAIIYGLIF